MEVKDLLAFVLMAFGAVVAAFSYLVLESAPLTAMGLGVTVTGASLILTPRFVVPKEFVIKLLESFSRNLESLLESLGTGGKGYVLWKEGKAYLAVPLRGRAEGVPADLRPGLVRDRGAVYLVVELPLIGPTSEGPAISEELFVSELSACKSVSLDLVGDRVIVTLEDPAVPLSAGRMGTATGSILSVLAAATASARFGVLLRFLEERLESDRVIAVYEVVGRP